MLYVDFTTLEHLPQAMEMRCESLILKSLPKPIYQITASRSSVYRTVICNSREVQRIES